MPSDRNALMYQFYIFHALHLNRLRYAGSPISSDKCQVLTPHSGYVRALAYGQEGKLYSGGWDSAVCCTPT